MKADPRFQNMPKPFWASVRTLSQALGYTAKGKLKGKGNSQIRVPTIEEMARGFTKLGLDPTALRSEAGGPTQLGIDLSAYFEFRADVINHRVRNHLMDRDAAQALFAELRAKFKPVKTVPMNKQKGDKRAEAFFTGIVMTLIEAHAEGIDFNSDPRELTTVTRNGAPVRTLARRVDGAFPSAVNPIAIWEIKEYYYTTTFGSRVADGVYESLLDGMEIEELYVNEKIQIEHYLMVDDYNTWWNDGKAYLCRMIDMIHMGYADEVLFGSEVRDRLPEIVSQWVRKYKTLNPTAND